MRFEENGEGPDFLEYIRAGGCWSNVGRYGGKQQVSIGYGCESVKACLLFSKFSIFSLELFHMRPFMP